MTNVIVNVKEKEEIDILSKEALSLPKRERIKLLLSAKSIPIVTKRTAIEKQIKEVIELHDFVNMLFVAMYPDENSDAEYLDNIINSFIDDICDTSTNIMQSYESFDNINDKISNFAYDVFQKYPDEYEDFDLDEIFVFKNVQEKIDFFRYKYKEIGREEFLKDLKSYIE